MVSVGVVVLLPKATDCRPNAHAHAHAHVVVVFAFAFEVAVAERHTVVLLVHGKERNLGNDGGGKDYSA